MDKIVGKIVITCMMLYAQALVCSNIELRAVDRNGVMLKEIAADTRFNIQVLVRNCNRTQQVMPHVPGLDALVVEGRQTTIHSVNGVNTVTYGYQVHADKAGVYSLGPVELDHNGTRECSETCSLKVVPHLQGSTAQANRAITAFARLTAHKTRVVQGEKINCTLRFYSSQSNGQVQNVGEPQLVGLALKERKGPVAGTEVINNVSYNYLEWQWQLYPIKSGKIVLPAYRIDYAVPDDSRSMSPVAFLMGHHMSVKRVYSNALEFTVDAVPDHKGPVYAIGTFRNFTAKITPTTVVEGDGMVLTLELEGDADLEALSMPALEGMPDALKWYESQRACTPHKNGFGKISCEYIVQALKKGIWEIPAQKLIYFDVTKKKYVSLETTPITVTVKAGAGKTFADRSRELQAAAQVATAVDAQAAIEHDVRPLCYAGPLFAHEERCVPWWLFLLLGVVPVVIVGGKKVSAHLNTDRSSTVPTQATIFAITRNALQRAEHDQAVGRLHPLLIDYFTVKLTESRASLNEEVIMQALQSAGCTQQQCADWQQFFAQCAQQAFSGAHTQGTEKQLFVQANTWLTFLEKKL